MWRLESVNGHIVVTVRAPGETSDVGLCDKFENFSLVKVLVCQSIAQTNESDSSASGTDYRRGSTRKSYRVAAKDVIMKGESIGISCRGRGRHMALYGWCGRRTVGREVREDGAAVHSRGAHARRLKIRVPTYPYFIFKTRKPEGDSR